MARAVSNNKQIAPGGNTHWGVFAILMVGAFMALLDVTIVNVALPSIQHGLHTGTSTLEWVVAGYTLTLGLALIPAGRIGDNIGHRRTFLIGITIFTLASLFCSLSQNSAEIIIARLLQGVGAGIFQPAVTSFIQILFQGKARSRAFSIYGATIGLSTAIGPLLGGLLVQAGGDQWGWRLVFLVNVPIGLVIIPLAYRLLPHKEQTDNRKRSIDPIGVGLLSAGLVLLLLPLVEGQHLGWPLWTYICLIASVPIFYALWRWENRQERKMREPLLPTHLLRQRSFAAGCLLALIYFASFTSIFFTLSILWQTGFMRSALATGLAIVPFAIGSMVAAAVSDTVSTKVGRWVLVIGCALVAIGLSGTLLMLHVGGASVSSWDLVVPLLVAGIGNGLFIAPNQDFILASVERKDAGAASGVLVTSQRVGSALGIAIIGTLLFSNIVVKPGPNALAVAFSHGAQVATLLNVGFVLVALVLVFLLPKKVATIVSTS